MKKQTPPKDKNRERVEKIVDEVMKIGDELQSLAKRAKQKFHSADEITKKKIIGGLAGAAAILTAAVGLKKMRCCRKKKNEKK